MLYERLKLMFSLIFLIAAVVVTHVDAQTSCTTPNRQTGVCVPISTCQVITKLLKMWPNPPPPQVVHFIEMSQCGTLNDVTYVCCDQKSVIDGGASAPPPPPSPPIPTTQKATITQVPEVVSRIDSRIRSSDAKSDADVQSGMAILESSRCGITYSDRVANGVDAELMEFPWMALLVYDDGVTRTMDCGGSLITDRYVLTAAHCIRRSLKVKLASVRLGEHDTKYAIDCVGRRRKRKCAPEIQEIDIEEAIYHNDYNPAKFCDDIGLLRLVSKATFRKNVQPICLPITSASQAANLKHLQIAGWGQIESGLKASVLQKALVVMHDNEYCQSIHRLINVTDKQLCAGGDDQIASCKGDSGGPLFMSTRYRNTVRYIQYGVVSAGSSLCGTTFPDVFAKVFSYLPWIAANINP